MNRAGQVTPGASTTQRERDLRREHRQPLRAQAQTLEVFAEGAWRPLRGDVVDVSPSGMGLVVDQPLPNGAPVRVAFAVEPHHVFPPGQRWRRARENVIQEGRIMYSQEEPEVPGIWRAGVALPPLPPASSGHTIIRVVCLAVLVALIAALVTLQPGAMLGVALTVAAIVVVVVLAVSELGYAAARRTYTGAAAAWETTAAATPPSAREGR
jgi:hypothetical protein